MGHGLGVGDGLLSLAVGDGVCGARAKRLTGLAGLAMVCAVGGGCDGGCMPLAVYVVVMVVGFV
uniref:Uncharacterized protein n=1 Tax=Fagus sylvatica TaxID=28930 RepID=A0A2N9GH43_FAGSY